MDLHVVMRTLAGKRPVFHSEADFQHALAMEIARLDPAAQVRLEYRPLSDERVYLDLWIGGGNRSLAIELKYKTRLASVKWKGERFDLANQGAQDLGAYDVWKDVQRLENVCSRRNGIEGYVILLSNDASYWTGTANEGTVGGAFRLQEGRVAGGGLSWASHAADGTMRGREEPIALRGSYHISWRDYFRFGTGTGLTFRYVIIPVVVGAEVRLATQLGLEPRAVRQRQVLPAIGPRRSKYQPLYDFLVVQTDNRVEMTYTRFEEIVGGQIPESARKHPASFWANHHGGTHVWATKWMDAGWRVESHNPVTERVVFVRTGTPNPPRP